MNNFYFTCSAMLVFATSTFAQQQALQTDTSAKAFNQTIFNPIR